MPDPTPPEPPQGHTAPRIPDHLPLSMQDINLMRCTTCGTLLTGSWPITKQDARAGQDHYLDHHLDHVLTDRVPRPPFTNCAIQDPFWFDEHAPKETDHA